MTVNEKLESFGLSKYGSKTRFAEAMGMSLQNLLQYLGPAAKREPGCGFLKKVSALGCDMNWLLSDNYKSIDYVNEKSLNYNSVNITKLQNDYNQLKIENLKLKKFVKSGLNDILDKLDNI